MPTIEAPAVMPVMATFRASVPGLPLPNWTRLFEQVRPKSARP